MRKSLKKDNKFKRKNRTNKYKKHQKGGEGDTCFDIIEGDDINIKEYLEDNPSNIIVNVDGKLWCSSRESLMHRVDDNIVYICNAPVTYYSGFAANRGPNGEEIYQLKPYVSLRDLGLGWGGICSLENIYKVILRSEDKIFNFERVGEAIAIISRNTIEIERNMMSGFDVPGDYLTGVMHCQAGSDRPIYKITSESNPDYEDTEGERFTPLARNLFGDMMVEEEDAVAEEDEDEYEEEEVITPRISREHQVGDNSVEYFIEDETVNAIIRNYRLSLCDDVMLDATAERKEASFVFKSLFNEEIRKIIYGQTRFNFNLNNTLGFYYNLDGFNLLADNNENYVISMLGLRNNIRTEEATTLHLLLKPTDKLIFTLLCKFTRSTTMTIDTFTGAIGQINQLISILNEKNNEMSGDTEPFIIFDNYYHIDYEPEQIVTPTRTYLMYLSEYNSLTRRKTRREPNGFYIVYNNYDSRIEEGETRFRSKLLLTSGDINIDSLTNFHDSLDYFIDEIQSYGRQILYLDVITQTIITDGEDLERIGRLTSQGLISNQDGRDIIYGGKKKNRQSKNKNKKKQRKTKKNKKQKTK